MRLESILIKNFRNISEANLKDFKSVNVITGENAQGKTNLLESIYFLSTLSSYRLKKTYLNLIKLGEEFLSVKGEIEKNSIKKVLEVNFLNSKQTKAKVNDNAVLKKSDYVGELKTVNFSFEDIDIIKRAPIDRRKNLNLLISMASKAYLSDLQKYYQILSQKNKLLWQVNLKTSDEKNLSLWDEQLIEKGVSIIKKRLEVINILNNKIKIILKQISEGKEEAELKYKGSFEVKDEIEKDFKKRLQEARKDEILKKASLIGPHRDDMIFMVNGQDARYFCSEGQQKSVAISLKTAEYEFIKEETNDEPVVLLDDIFFDLDEGRRKIVLGIFSKITQIFIAGTKDKNFAKYFKEFKYISIKEGKIEDS